MALTLRVGLSSVHCPALDECQTFIQLAQKIRIQIRGAYCAGYSRGSRRARIAQLFDAAIVSSTGVV